MKSRFKVTPVFTFQSMEEKDQEEVSTSGPVSFNHLPSLPAKYPWLVVQSAADNFAEHCFYNLHNPSSQYRCRIRQLGGRCIRGCFHGWLVLSNHPHNDIWSLWNPSTSKTIHLPPLNLKDGDCDSIGDCCLTSPPNDPNSILLLTRTDKPTFVFCWPDSQRKWLRWTERSYVKQLKRITSDGLLINSLNCCNDEVLIRLSLVGACPFPSYGRYCSLSYYLKGFCSELFCIKVGFREETKKTPVMVSLFKLDTTSIKWDNTEGFKDSDTTREGVDRKSFIHLYKSTRMWENIDNLKDAVFFVDLSRDHSVFYNTEIASDLGGYVHIRGKMAKTIYSYYVKDKTFSVLSMPSLVLPTSYVSLWECRLEGDHGETSCNVDAKQEEQEKEVAMVVKAVTGDEVDSNESRLLNLPFDILEMIMKFSIGVEYVNFRATCRQCHLAAPVIKWNNERLQTYSPASPWLIVFNNQKGIITLIDPMFGDKYFMKETSVVVRDIMVCCSQYGWLLIYCRLGLVFYNPFTRAIRGLPRLKVVLHSLWFSAPPTSPDCMVIGLATSNDTYAYIHLLAREKSWRSLYLGADPFSLRFSTFYRQSLYALSEEGKLYVLKYLTEDDYSCELVEAEIPRSPLADYFLVKSDQHLLLVIVHDFRDPIDVFKLNETEKWEKIESLGRYMIYISSVTCVCVEAKSPEMENKIYFPEVDSKNGKIAFYSLDTLTYHTFNGKDIEESFGCRSYHHDPHAWIEPSWITLDSDI